MNLVPLDQQNIVDLRSDTVTRPTDEMIRAMNECVVGDDVIGDDPTIIELQNLAAKMVGKEAALFVPSGTMGNQIALCCHTKPGDAILIEEEAHILYYEVGAPALLAGVVSWTLPSNKGVLDPAVVEKRILKADLHTPGTTLLCLENTHNRAGGTVMPIEILEDLQILAKREGMKVHLDGARVFNAAVALKVPITEITKHVDSVNFCLSKGLSSPVGSLLCGSKELIDQALVWRKRLGGGMRQAGILAACGIVSLTKMVDRLADDHARARTLAGLAAEVKGFEIDWDTIQTNIVSIGTAEPSKDVLAKLKERGLWAGYVGPNRIKFVTHADFDDEKMAKAEQVLRAIAK